MGIIPRSEKDLLPKGDEPIPSISNEPGQAQSHFKSDSHSATDPNRLPLYLNIAGMWCPACAWVIEEAVKKEPGVSQATCYFSTDRFRCEYDPVRTSPKKITAAIHQLGYGAASDCDGAQSLWKKKEFLRFVVSAFLTMNIMMLSFALYSGFLTELSQFDIRMISWPIFVMAAVVFFYGGIRIHRRALSGFRATAFGMETLISVGSSVAFFYSAYNFMRGSMHVYFDTAAMLITLVLLGKTLETRAKDAVTSDLDTFFSLRPKKVRLCGDAYPRGRYVSADQLETGDMFLIETDESAAADGIVVEGTGALDESSLTGEARPVDKQPGDLVRSGSTVIKGKLKIRAQQVGDESILGQMIRIMEKTLEQRTPLEGRTDRLLQWFVPGVILVAMATGLGWYLFGTTAENALIRSVTVLVISCPCALGIAIPLTRVAGIAVAARHGMLIRDFSSFERTTAISDIVFDKTGTVTHGQWKLVRTLIHKPFIKNDVLALAAGLEAHSDHYIALAIQRHARAKKIIPATFDHAEIAENGVAGDIGGKKIRIGAWAFTHPEKPKSHITQDATDAGEEGYTSRVYVTINGDTAATFEFGDSLKDGARETVEALHDMGYATALVSGDEDRITQIIGRAIGIGRSTGGMLPTDKANILQELRTSGRSVAMVGDGINDAPALAQSDLALAVHGNYLLGKEAADVSLMRGDPRQVLDFIKLAGRVNRKIHQNFFGAFFYNIISIPIAISGMLTPLVAVSAMLLSSLSVIGNTLLLIKTKHL